MELQDVFEDAFELVIATSEGEEEMVDWANEPEDLEGSLPAAIQQARINKKQDPEGRDRIVALKRVLKRTIV